MPIIELKQTITRYLKLNMGFTFIELLVVISLISLMICIAVPRFQNTLLPDKTNEFTRWMMAKVQVLKANAVQDQKRYALHVNLDFNKMWSTHALMSEEELQNASQNAYQPPGNLKLLDVEYPGEEPTSGGQANIKFYQKGYSDMAMIHVEDDNAEQLSFAVEPFLPHLRVHQKYVRFED